MPGAAVKIEIPSPELWTPASPHLYDLRITAATDSVQALLWIGIHLYKSFGS